MNVFYKKRASLVCKPKTMCSSSSPMGFSDSGDILLLDLCKKNFKLLTCLSF